MTAPNKQNRSSEELQMRALIVPELRRLWPEARIVHELPLRYSQRRIDLAAICPDKLISVEIKSSNDVADRLEEQLRGFKPVSWRVIAALAPKWNAKLPMKQVEGRPPGYMRSQHTPCQEIIRSVGGIETWTVDAAAGSIERTGGSWSDNDTPWHAQMLDMLWVAELRVIAGTHRVSVGQRASHTQLVRECSELMTGREIRRAVCAALRARDAFAAESDPPVTASRSPSLTNIQTALEV